MSEVAGDKLDRKEQIHHHHHHDYQEQRPIWDKESIRFRSATEQDVEVCLDLEQASYPANEAASRESLTLRQTQASAYFQVAFLPVSSKNPPNDSGEHAPPVEELVVGFICATRCVEFTHASMSRHVPDGPLLAIHSVVVRPEYRRQGLATFMLQRYVQHVRIHNENANHRASASIRKLVLLSKQHLQTLYVHCGFQVQRPSPIVHGTEQWYDLVLDLQDSQDIMAPSTNTASRTPAIVPSGYSCFVVDAFADPHRSGTGNPAGVVIITSHSDHDDPAYAAAKDDPKILTWMQMVAAEFNHSETAFLWPYRSTMSPEDKTDAAAFYIRYFTPTVEVPLCGHATLASAAVLYQVNLVRRDLSVVFHARQDVLVVQLDVPSETRTETSLPPNAWVSRIRMEFPSKPALPLVDPASVKGAHDMLQTALGIDAADILFLGLSSIGDLLCEVTPNALKRIGYGPDLLIRALMDWNGYSRGVIVCSAAASADDQAGSSPPSSSAVDFCSRFFGPKAGIDEDPVTGSAHCVLAPYYFAKNQDRSVLIGQQLSSRGGLVECAIVRRPDHGDGVVSITGFAVTTIQGTLLLQPNLQANEVK